MLAAFLNTTLLGKRQAKSKLGTSEPQTATERHIARVEMPPGLPKTSLRDALLQYRLRHTQHPHEAEALDWTLGQLDPSFGLVAIKVPQQISLVLLEALIQYSQAHAELQLDAAHAVGRQRHARSARRPPSRSARRPPSPRGAPPPSPRDAPCTTHAAA